MTISKELQAAGFVEIPSTEWPTISAGDFPEMIVLVDGVPAGDAMMHAVAGASGSVLRLVIDDDGKAREVLDDGHLVQLVVPAYVADVHFDLYGELDEVLRRHFNVALTRRDFTTLCVRFRLDAIEPQAYHLAELAAGGDRVERYSAAKSLKAALAQRKP